MEAATGGTDPPPKAIEAPRGGQAPKATALRGLLDSLVALVPTGQQGTARGLAKEVQSLFKALEQGSQQKEGSEAVTVTHLQKVVTEAVRAAVGPTQGLTQGRSWATVAAGATSSLGTAPASYPTKTIP